jgi:predicted AlkP superfamily phosphohydrolase/phosphomutase
MRILIILILTILILISLGDSAQAYIGPGAGFAFLSSFIILFLAFALALFYLLSWPLRFLLRALSGKRKGSRKNAMAERVVVIGLDGMDPGLAVKFMRQGRLPNFRKLRQEGTFSPLGTIWPPISPAAWSSFATGVDPSYHNIFDFLTRDPITYSPALSSTEIKNASRMLPIGKYKIPLGKPQLKLLRKSKTFWKILGENGIFSSIIRVPITFPPEKFNGVLLSGMCTPDIMGSQGTFAFYTTNGNAPKIKEAGLCYHVEAKGDTVRTFLHGPENPLVPNNGQVKIPLEIKINAEKNKASVKLCGQLIQLEPETYSPWIKVIFEPGLKTKIRGICRFYLSSISPDLKLYVSPINIDPGKPALPISHPFIYSVYLSKLIGSYGTLGLAEDTWALNGRIIDEDSFLQQAYLLFEEREKMLMSALERTRNGLCTCVFDTTDRVQHMFFRCLDETHPSNRDKEVDRYKNVIEELYVRMDQLLGRVLDKINGNTVVVVISDHGFAQFRRGVNLNTWLFQNGYLAIKDGKSISGDWFEGVDWDKTRAYSLGLAGIFINRKGRESNGIVKDGRDLEALKAELIEKLAGLRDEETGNVAIRKVINTQSVFSGPYAIDAPDLLIGYNRGYRSSWACAKGCVTESVFEDNIKHWSGDHSVDPQLVPGVFFSNRKIAQRNPHMTDIAPTILQLFGVEMPSYMQGTPLFGDYQGAKEKKPEN